MDTRIYQVNPDRPEIEPIREAAGFIRRGGLVAFPTETVYGLGADWRNPESLARLAQLKERPKTKPFTIHIFGREALAGLEIEPSAEANAVMDRFWPGPLTLVLPVKTGGRIGVRFPADNVACLFLRECATPVAASSANLAGGRAPITGEQVAAVFRGKVEAIIDAGRTAVKTESTVLDLTTMPGRILREGAVAREELEKLLGPEKIARVKKILFVCTGNSCRSPMAAALLERMLGERRDQFRIFSAGIAALDGAGATKEAIEAMAENGIDISRHRSAELNGQMAREADLILVMEFVHKDVIQIKYPEAEKKTFLLDEYAGGAERPREIPDPVGKSVTEYRRVRKLLAEILERMLTKL